MGKIVKEKIMEKSVVLLDGGMGQELIRRSGQPPTPLWSARVMLDNPDLVEELHIDFIKACLLYTSPSPRDRTRSRMPSSA